MKITSKFMIWLMGLTTMMRYFVIAVLFHVLILFILGSIRIVTEFPKIKAYFDGAPVAPIEAKDEMDPFAPLRDFEYNGPTLGDGKGTPGKGPGGVPTAAGTTPTEYKASITPMDSSAADSAVAEVIGVVSDSATAVARLQGGIGGMAAPTSGFGEGKFGTSGIKGPGGGGIAHFGQRSGPKRAQMIGQHGGSSEAEKAVLAALRWLKEHQESDGSWAPSANPAAKTGLAILCYLGHGETPDSEEFGSTVSKGLSYLASVVGSEGIVRSQSMYEQGIVTFALAEAYGMTQSPLAREPLDRAVKAILESQKVKKTNKIHEGGWRYTPTSADADTSVAGWNIMGLKSARLAGIDIPQEAMDAAANYIWNMYGDGGFGYGGPGQGSATTAVGILCEQFLGHGDDKRLKKALDYYAHQKVNWATPAIGNALYAWYYATQAMFQAGGSHWTYWNHEIRDTLVKAQASDGHWDDPGKSIAGAEPVFSTTLCCLMLEVYYRYLPIYQDMEKNAIPGMPVLPTPGTPGPSASSG
jgi:hypothetical protein